MKQKVLHNNPGQYIGRIDQEEVGPSMEWCCKCQQYVLIRRVKWSSADSKDVYEQRICSRCSMTLSMTRRSDPSSNRRV